jgi:hypothetical protein
MRATLIRGLVLGLVALVLPACGSSSSSSSAPNSASNGTSGNFNDTDILTFPDEGRTHVPDGTVIDYQTDPPTSGDHYPEPEPGGFYTTEIAAGFLVHSMEHGGIIIYYSPAVTSDQQAALAAIANAHPGIFAQVVVVPRNDPTYPIILTAWTHMLRLSTYDQSRIDNFIALFIGQGPEAAP